MLLRFYNLSKSFICEKEVASPKIVSDVETGDSILSFTLQEPSSVIMPEWYVETQTQEYVVKEKNSDGQKIDYVCNLNLEDLEAKEQPSTITITESTIRAAATSVLNGTGWTVGACDISKVRNATLLDSQNSLNAIKKLCTAYICEPVYDTKNKTVSFYNAVGEDRGVYFMSSLNLKSLSVKQDSYDYYTVIIPIGKDNLTIESVNDGVGYLENYQYSTKRKVLIWTDTNYTDAQALKDDAELKLESISKPVAAYTGNIIDLAAVSDDYSILDYSLGDYVWLVDDATGTRERQRILKLTEYPDSPQNNTAEFCNLALSFDDLQSKYKAAAELVTATITNDGKFSLSDIMHIKDTPIDSSGNTIGGILRLATEAGTTADGKNKVYYSDTEPDVTNKKVGDTWFDTAHGNKVYGWNGTEWDDKQFGGDAIQNLAITNAKISNLDGGKITAGTITSLGAVTAGTFSLGNGAFAVDGNGKLTATGATISGAITANTGYIGGSSGGWTIASGVMKRTVADADGTKHCTGFQAYGTGSWAIAVNASNPDSWATAPFRVSHAGKMYASGAEVSGKITATDGTIGGCSISSGKLQVPAANVTGTLTASQINTTNLKVAAANVTGTLTASQINTTNLKVAAANVTGTIKATDIDATTGSIGGFTVNANGMKTDNFILYHKNGYDDYIEVKGTTSGVLNVAKLYPQALYLRTKNTTGDQVATISLNDWKFNASYPIESSDSGANARYFRVKNSKGQISLHVNDSGRIGLYSPTYTTWLVYKDTTGSITHNTSDKRSKVDKGFLDANEAETILTEIPVINFVYKEDVGHNNLEQSGIYAQDLRDILINHGFKNRKYIIANNANNEDDDEVYYDLNVPEDSVRYGVNYTALIPVLIKGWQIQQKKIDEQQKRLDALEARLAELEAKL